ncbi:integrase, catalytic region, zinc finger, CCHC-type containing protein [Tanacetum coccineum]
MTGNIKLLRKFVEKFIGTIRFGNEHFATITGYEDYVHGNVTICHVYYIEGLGHNLFSVDQFCDGDLEVVFRSKTYYLRNLEGQDLLTGARDSNLYTISISDMAASSPITHFKLELIHMDLCGPMRVESINGKKYSLVIVDNYSCYMWVYFLCTKDMAPHMIMKFIAQVQLNFKLQIQKVRSENGTKFKNATLQSHSEKLGIMQQFSIARTPQQNSVVECRNHTLVEAARTMLLFSKAS